MKYKCPKCGWSENGYRDKYCSWCGQQLPSVQKVDRFNPDTLDSRMDELKGDIKNWIIDVRECFHGRGIDQKWARRLIEDFAIWFIDVAGMKDEKSLFLEEKPLEINIPLSEICDEKADERNNTTNDCDKITGNRKKFFRLPTKTEIWAFYAGVWVVLIGFWLLAKFIG